MENASKALLIAASVLIVILLIAFSMRIFNTTSGTADKMGGTMQTTEMATFNSKFTAYAGNKKSAAQVKALANVVIANNATNALNTVQLKVLDYDATPDATNITSYVADLSGSYKIEVTEYSTKGYVSTITISVSN